MHFNVWVNVNSWVVLLCVVTLVHIQSSFNYPNYLFLIKKAYSLVDQEPSSIPMIKSGHITCIRE